MSSLTPIASTSTTSAPFGTPAERVQLAIQAQVALAQLERDFFSASTAPLRPPLHAVRPARDGGTSAGPACAARPAGTPRFRFGDRRWRARQPAGSPTRSRCVRAARAIPRKEELYDLGIL